MNQKSFLVVIPTRNRAALAISAVKSVLNQRDTGIQVIVSDNSTDEAEVANLSEYCRELNDGRVCYIRPDAPMSMTVHWNWAMGRALELCEADHVIFLTDRLLLKPFALEDLDKIVDAHPDKVITYSWDLINDLDLPVISFQLIRTEKIYEVSSRDLLDLAAQSYFNNSLPRMLNCCCPRKIIEDLYEKQGCYFFSDNPDFNFAYTCLDSVDSIIYYDNPLMISYGLSVSNGTNFLRGLFNKKDSAKDFLENIKLDQDTDDLISILPLSVTKFIAYEYNLVKRRSGNSKFKELDRDKLLQNFLENAILYEDNQEKLNAFKTVYFIDKLKFPRFIVKAYVNFYKRRLINKLQSKIGSTASLEMIKTHPSVEDAVNYIINNPRVPTTTKAFFDVRIGRSPRET